MVLLFALWECGGGRFACSFEHKAESYVRFWSDPKFVSTLSLLKDMDYNEQHLSSNCLN